MSVIKKHVAPCLYISVMYKWRRRGLYSKAVRDMRAQYWLRYSYGYGTAPQYLTDAVQSVTSASIIAGLRSANNAKYVKRCTRTKFGERGFSFSGPAAWNRLPSDLQRCSDTDGFKKKLDFFVSTCF